MAASPPLSTFLAVPGGRILSKVWIPSHRLAFSGALLEFQFAGALPYEGLYQPLDGMADYGGDM